MIVSDASHNRPQAYVHRHKLRKRLQGFTKQGPHDVCMISEELLQLLCKIDSSNDDDIGLFGKEDAFRKKCGQIDDNDNGKIPG